LVYSGEVESVVIPGTEGEFTVLKDHAPLISAIRPGVIVVEKTAAAKLRLYVRGGFAEVAPSGLTILADQALPLEEVDAAKLDASKYLVFGGVSGASICFEGFCNAISIASFALSGLLAGVGRLIMRLQGGPSARSFVSCCR